LFTHAFGISLSLSSLHARIIITLTQLGVVVAIAQTLIDEGWACTAFKNGIGMPPPPPM
jgi:hypothetical protein